MGADLRKQGTVPRDTFATSFGVLVAAAGSAVGLGNIWKFPYITGGHGGAAFILIYILCVLMLGVPVMLAELAIGRRGQGSPMRSFHRIAPGSKWSLVGLLAVLTPFLILTFYSTVGGWTIEYMVDSFGINAGALGNGETFFADFVADPVRPVLWQCAFMLLTAGVVLFGVSKGIERASKVLMPLLFLLVAAMCVRSVTLPNAGEGLRFLFKPDFSKVNGETFLAALGQAFFSLSLGMGALITYGSYVKKEVNLMSITAQVCIADTVMAILCGVMILPAVFSFGVEPTAGPKLIFVTLPNIFAKMLLGGLFSFIFFTLVLIAALTSSISLFEVCTSFLKEHARMSRMWATVVSLLAVLLIGIGVTLSMGGGKALSALSIAGMNLFDSVDFLTSNIMLPVGALLTVVFVAWGPGKHILRPEVSNEGTLRVGYYPALRVLLRYCCPLFILVILLFGLFT